MRKLKRRPLRGPEGPAANVRGDETLAGAAGARVPRGVGRAAGDGLYLDQLTGAAFMCFDPKHGHPVGGGDFFHQGLRAICRDARAALAESRPTA